MHSLKYQYRQWVVDFCDWSEENDYEGEIPRRMQIYKNRARVFGFWKKLGTDKETEEVLKELRSGEKKIYPFWGSMTNKNGEESPEEIWRKVKNSEIAWYEYRREKVEIEWYDYREGVILGEVRALWRLKGVKPPNEEMF